MRIDDTPVSEMTLRQRAAIAAMQGIIGSELTSVPECATLGELYTAAAIVSVGFADALCRELAKPRVKQPWQPMRTAPVGVLVEVVRHDGISRLKKTADGVWRWPRGPEAWPEDSYFAWREIETDDTPEQLPTEPIQ